MHVNRGQNHVEGTVFVEGECCGEANRQLGLGGDQECGDKSQLRRFCALVGLCVLMGIRDKEKLQVLIAVKMQRGLQSSVY